MSINPSYARRNFGKTQWLYLGLILAATFISFSPILENEFTNWDDLHFIVENPQVKEFSLSQLKTAFTKTYAKVYAPLTIVSWALQHQWVGFEPFTYFLVNLLLHGAVSVMVFILALRLGLAPVAAFLGALLFGVHPIHVESVAWATERKDVLFSCFYMLALLQYWSYLQSGRRGPYVLSILFGFLSLLSKAMALSLPIVCGALDYYHQRKFSKSMVLDKLPYFLYIVPIAAITFFQHADPSSVTMPGATWQEAIPLFFFSFSFYLQKFVFPLNLVPYYQLPQPLSITHAPYLVALVVFVAYVFLLVRYRKNRLFIFSFLFFLGSIFFMLRFGTFVSYTSVVADRFIYISSVGLCIFAGEFIYQSVLALERHGAHVKRAVIILLGVVYGLLAGKTFNQSRIWKDSITYWSYAIETNALNKSRAYAFRSHAHALMGNWQQALKDSQSAIELNPSHAAGYAQRGAVFIRLGKEDQALADLNKALELDHAKAYVLVNRAAIYIEKGMLEEAVLDASNALESGEGDAKAYAIRGKAYGLMGDLVQAIDDLSRSIALDPSDPLVYYDRGFFLSQAGHLEEAIVDYTGALLIDPNDVMTLDQRGSLYFALGQYERALVDFNKALSLNNGYPRSYNNRGSVLLVKGEWKAALGDFNKAISLDENYALAYLNRSKVHQGLNEIDLALADAHMARQLGLEVDEGYINELKQE